MHNLRHQFSGRIAAHHFDMNRIVQNACGQRFDFIRESGGEQQVLPVHRQQRQNAANITDKAHV
jgi:hypothetical protein